MLYVQIKRPDIRTESLLMTKRGEVLEYLGLTMGYRKIER